jgi:hypothetical protein
VRVAAGYLVCIYRCVEFTACQCGVLFLHSCAGCCLAVRNLLSALCGAVCVRVCVCSGTSQSVHGGSLYVSFSPSVLSTCILLLVYASAAVHRMRGWLRGAALECARCRGLPGVYLSMSCVCCVPVRAGCCFSIGVCGVLFIGVGLLFRVFCRFWLSMLRVCAVMLRVCGLDSFGLCLVAAWEFFSRIKCFLSTSNVEVFNVIC